MSGQIPHTEEKALFLRIAEDDTDAYTRIFHLFTPRLYPYILKIARDEQLARELLQETFLRLWVKRADLRNVDLPDSWLFRVAANICLGHLREQALHQRHLSVVGKSVAGGPRTPADESEGRELQRLIRQAVEALPEKRREIYRLSREEGLSHQKIAERLGISPSTVNNQLGASLKFIHQWLHNSTGLPLAVLVALFLL